MQLGERLWHGNGDMVSLNVEVGKQRADSKGSWLY